MERHAEQPLLIFAPRLALADVEKHLPLGMDRMFVAWQNDDCPALFQAKQPPGTIRRGLQPKRPGGLQALPDRL